MGAGGIDNETAAKLRHVIGRVERIEDDIAGLNKDKSEVYKEAKSFGLDVKALKALVSKRRKMAMNADGFSEQEAVVEMYEAALESRPSRAYTRETPHDLITGEIPEEAISRLAEMNAGIATALSGAGLVAVALTPLRSIPPSIPEPAPDWPEMPAGLDRNRQAGAAK